MRSTTVDRTEKRRREERERERESIFQRAIRSLVNLQENCVLQTCFEKRIGGNCGQGRVRLAGKQVRQRRVKRMGGPRVGGEDQDEDREEEKGREPFLALGRSSLN